MKFKFLPIFILFIFSLILFIPLFYPQRNIIATPEMIGSDNVKFHYPLKYFYQTKLRENKLPLWAKNIGAGFPVLAQSEIAIFNPINFITLKFFNLITAINLQYLLIYFLLSIFSFYLARSLQFSNLAALFFSITFSYSSLLIFNLIHFSHIHTIVYFPLVVALTINYFQKSSPKYFFLLIGSLTLQLLAGHYQYFFITAFFVFSYIFFWFIIKKKIEWKILLKTILAYLISFSFAAVQIAPSIELLSLSTRSQEMFGGIGFQNGYVPLKILLTFFDPYLLGKVRDTSYRLDQYIGPWDGNLFIGVIAVISLMIFLLKLNFWRKSTLFPQIKIFTILLVLSLILSFGNNSPFYFLFALPPFNFFRANSRFLLISVFCLSLLSSLGFDYILKKPLKNTPKHLIFVVTISFLILEKLFLFYDFHIIKPANLFFLKKDNHYQRLFNSSTIPYYHFENLLSKLGYKDNKINSVYIEIIKQSNLANYNLVLDQPTLNYESGILLSRHSLFLGSIENLEYFLSTEAKEASLSGRALNLLRYAAVNKISSVIPYNNFSSQAIELDTDISSQYKKDLHYYFYRMKKTNKRIQFYTQFYKISTVKEFTDVINSKNLEKFVLIEDDFPDSVLKKINYSSDKDNFSYKVYRNKDEIIQVKTKSLSNGILVLADTYYPGWKAYIDGKETKIYRANFLFRGIYLQKGEHTVEFKYVPESFYLGLKISLLTFLALIGVVFIIYLKKRPRVV